MSAEFITIAANRAADTFLAFLAVPQAGSGPGIVLLHTAFGLDRHMRDMARLYAEEGYVVICPDLYLAHRAGAGPRPERGGPAADAGPLPEIRP